MKNIEKVLLTISLECSKQTRLAEVDCFDDIATKAKISLENLRTYLDELKNGGYIKYSIEDNFVYLTEQGKKYIATNNLDPAIAQNQFRGSMLSQS